MIPHPPFSLNRLVGGIAVLVALFPWVGFGLMDMDSQPWPLLAFGLFLLLCGQQIKLPPHFPLLATLVFVGFALALVRTADPHPFLVARAAYNYVCLLLIFLAFFNYIVRYGFPFRIFIVANVIWIVGGLIELFAPEMLELFSPRRTNEGRGMTSFSPEPTFFGIYLFFSSWLVLKACNYGFRKYAFLHLANILAIVLLARSSMVVLFLLLVFLSILTAHMFRGRFSLRSLGAGILIAALLGWGGFLAFSLLEGSRILHLGLRIATEGGILNIFYLDGSLNKRLEAIVFSMHSSFLNGFLPSGFDSFSDFRQELVFFYQGFFWSNQVTLKILSWIGDLIFHFGFLGFLFLVVLFQSLWDRTSKGILELGLLGIILFSAIPLAFPLVPMLFAVYSYGHHRAKLLRQRETQVLVADRGPTHAALPAAE